MHRRTRSTSGGWLLAITLLLAVTACGTSAPSAAPGGGRTIRSEAVLTIPVAGSATLLEAVSKPNLVAGVYVGRVASVRSYAVGGGEDVHSDVQLIRRDGSRVTYTAVGGTVPGRDLTAIADPPMGERPTEAQLDEPVTVTVEGVLIPSVGQDIVVFYSPDKIGGNVLAGGLTLVVTQTDSGPRYSFPGEPLVKTWKPPASETELNALLKAVHAG